MALITNLGWTYFETPTGTLIRISEDSVQRNLRKDGLWFIKNFRHVKLTTREKLDLIAKALDHVSKSSLPNARRFTLGVNTKKLKSEAQLLAAGWPDCLQTENDRSVWLQKYNSLPNNLRFGAGRHLFNRFLQQYCSQNNKFTFVDVDSIVSRDDVCDPDPKTGAFLPDHFSRRGYLAIATEIAAALQEVPHAT
jgi:hypothetical protein